MNDITSSRPTTTRATSWNTVDWLRSVPRVAIPVYQREYRWSPSTCEQLLSDIRRVADAEIGSSHFIGSVLGATDGGGEMTLVDGQQRVTTLMLMLAAIRDRAVKEDRAVAHDVSAIVLQDGDPTRPKLRPHQRYDDVVLRLMTGDRLANDRAPEDDVSAFEANYEALSNGIGADWRRVWRGLQRLEHVAIELRPQANAQQIFESLNSTGARLADDELIHNYIHMGRVHSEQLELEESTWSPIEQATRGMIREFWRDCLVWSSQDQPDLSGEFGVYRAFRRRYPDPRKDLTPEVRTQWVKLAGWYAVLLEPKREQDPDVAIRLRWVSAFGGTPRPLLLGMYGDYVEQRIEKATLIEALEQLQTMLIRRALVNLERDIGMIGRLCRELRETGYPLEGLVRRTPEDPQVRLALSHGSLPHAGYVLERLQRPKEDIQWLQIEHIHPQIPRHDWSGDGGVTTWGGLTNDQQAEYRTVLNTIGNLTLLEAPLNQGASNRSFRDKAGYYGKSGVVETRTLASHGTWDYAAIKERTARLTADFLRVWPRPRTVPMDQDQELVRVVDLPLVAVRGYPQMFDYAMFEGAIWGDVKTAKQLLVKLTDELWNRDAAKLQSCEHGWFVRKERERGKAHERLSSGMFLYTGWANQYLLEVAQEFISAFGLDDQAKVRLVDRTDSAG